MHRVLPEPLSRTRPVGWPGWWAWAIFALRFLNRVAFATWIGGFVFYAAVVVPDLHETFGGMETGEISRRVAVVLYEIGASALALGWVILAVDRVERSGWRGKVRFGLMVGSTVLLGVLIAMHRVIGARIDSGLDRDEFFPLHETYLTVFGVQWFGLLLMMALDLIPLRRVEAPTAPVIGTE
ncbi:hypothetical protein P12x_003113 [Tundrisphaera lichenicola]|uniref:hypothetical protein n=1 Tax=Tundrisphaera lichenicola TaxID=2029860 RepID=UPI003EB7FB97